MPLQGTGAAGPAPGSIPRVIGRPGVLLFAIAFVVVLIAIFYAIGYVLGRLVI